MTPTDPLLDALRQLTGRSDASFREGQREAIEALVDDRSRVLVVQRTGWGKSAVYFLTTYLLRQQGLGPTLLVSPLLALMRNQIDAASRLGLRCATINSASATTVGELERSLDRDEIDLVVISPERLANPEFAARIMPLVGRRPGLIVIDEVHCISDWGHDFRPDYRRIGQVLDRLAGSQVPILGCTATANDRVVDDVVQQFGDNLRTFRGPLAREGLALSTLRLDRQAERLAWLSEWIAEADGSGIVYCLTVRDVASVAEWLQAEGIAAEGYFGSQDNEQRLSAEARLQSNEIKVLVATTALGMGYDKPDLSFVVHFQCPSSPVAYYQQVGRAGRALETSVGVLLRGLEDEDIQNYFIETAFAAEHLMNDVVREFDKEGGPLSLINVQSRLNIRAGTLEGVVKQLNVDGMLERVGGTVYQRTPQPWTYPAQRIEQVTSARRAEQQAMVEYFHTQRCRMRFISDLLDDPWAEHDCGLCDNCTGVGAARPLPIELVARAEQFLRRRPIVVDAKKMRFDATTGSRRKIPEAEQLCDGRSLAKWGDGGWGELVRTDKQGGGAFDDRLVDAVVEMVADWSPQPAPAWVTCVPSLRSPELVSDLASRVADALGLPFHAVVRKIDERPPQRDQRNSSHQQHNVEGAFAVAESVLATPVLLVDDIVDSGWTLTEVGGQLRRAGSGVVYPLVLASWVRRD